MRQQIEVLAEWANLAALLAFSDSFEARAQLSPDQAYLLRLVIEEIATNIIKYGYADQPQGPIQVSCQYDSGTLSICIRDCGQPYDPRLHPEPDLEADVAMRDPGGLGLHFVREFADQVHYRHDSASGWNELTVIKMGAP
jgi:anti-sigma regulatory factor (Ser/Thr protein kinase)